MSDPGAGTTSTGGDRDKHACSNFSMALSISDSVMMSGGTKRTTLGPAGTTSMPAFSSALAT